MRIISGIYKGRKLKSSNDQSIRPTTNRIKEYIFNILQDFSDDKTVADFFAGSGNLGIEALSRGAAKVFFIEKAESSINVLRQNLSNIAIPVEKFTIIQQDVMDFAQQTKNKFDLMLLDPPFVYPELQKLIDMIFKGRILKASGLLVLEHEIKNPIEEIHEEYEIIKQKKYGRSLISFIVLREQNVG